MAAFDALDAFAGVFEDSSDDETSMPGPEPISTPAPEPAPEPEPIPEAARDAPEAAAAVTADDARPDPPLEVAIAEPAGSAAPSSPTVAASPAAPVDDALEEEQQEDAAAFPFDALDFLGLKEHLELRGFRELLGGARAGYCRAVRDEIEELFAGGFLVPSRNKLTAARDEKGRITAGFVRRKPGVHELDLVLEGAVVAPQALAICPSIQRFHEELAPKLIDVLHAVHPELRITVVDTIKVQLNEGVGGCFPMHYDTSGAHSRRTLTMLLYLNEDWAPGDGGELRLFPFPYQTVDIAPRLGTLAMFCATEMLHRVLPSRARRVCLSVWFAAEPAAAHRSFPNRAPPGLPAESAGFLRFLMQRDNRRLLSKVWFREEYATSFVDAFGGAGGGGGDGGGGGVDDDGRSEAEKAEELRRVLDLDARETDKAAQLLPHGLMDRLKATLLFATPDVEAA